MCQVGAVWAPWMGRREHKPEGVREAREMPALAHPYGLASGVGNESIDCADEKPPQLSVVPRPAFAASFDDEITD